MRNHVKWACVGICACSLAALATRCQGDGPAIEVGPNVHLSKALEGIEHFFCVAAADPNDANRLLAASEFAPPGSGRSLVVYASGDGGRTWRPTLERRSGPGRKYVDPTLAFGPDGAAYFGCVSGETEPRAGRLDPPKPGDLEGGGPAIFRSADGGATWGPAADIARYVDRPFLAVDTTAGRYRGRVYCFGTVDPAYALYASADGGRSFRPSADFSPGLPYRGTFPANPTVLSDGTLVVLYSGYVGAFDKVRQPYLSVRISRDGGATLGDERRVADWRPFNAIYGLPQLAAEPGSGRFRDRLYAVWGDELRGGMRVMFSRSADGGQTWSRPAVLSEQPDGEPGERSYDALVPAVAVNRAGVVAVSWYDRRGQPRMRGNLPDRRGWDVRLRASADGGETWATSVRVNDVTSAGPPVRHLLFTAGLAADASDRFHPVWADHRNGVLQLWTADIRVGPPR